MYEHISRVGFYEIIFFCDLIWQDASVIQTGSACREESGGGSLSSATEAIRFILCENT